MVLTKIIFLPLSAFIPFIPVKIKKFAFDFKGFFTGIKKDKDG
jgi:hypothetical protein